MRQLVLTLQSWVATRADSERGATAVEYGMLVALIAGVIVAIVTTLGTQVQATFSSISTTI